MVRRSSSGIISVGHFTVSRHDEVSTSSLKGEKLTDVLRLIVGGLSVDVVCEVGGGALYETLLTSTFDGLREPMLRMLSPNEPDFFLLKDCMLDFRLSEPNFSLSMTLLFLGESADGSTDGPGRVCGGGDVCCC